MLGGHTYWYTLDRNHKDLPESSRNYILDKGKAKIKLEKLVRQKYTISPKHFAVVLENIFKKVKWENKGIWLNGEYLSHFGVPDNILIFSNSNRPDELENKLKHLAESSINVGIKMNLKKTRKMKILWKMFLRTLRLMKSKVTCTLNRKNIG